MTKKEFIRQLSVDVGVNQKKASEIIEAYTDIITEVLATEKQFIIPGIGKLYTVVIPPHECYNPHKGEKFMVGETVRVKYKPSSQLKGILNME